MRNHGRDTTKKVGTSVLPGKMQNTAITYCPIYCATRFPAM
ncbi:hypothetical protein HMPREF3227_02082 [Corynebacterium sp. CMW7794]|nr:hypothetical protein HMPREF0307_02230 [Corynebacterium sp. DNF00584]KXI16134.1 hypothetical protein HMPREF3227_02082 [Corynebacterium sp. CMW7794]